MTEILLFVVVIAAVLALVFSHRLAVWQAAVDRRLTILFMRKAKAECVKITRVTAQALLSSVEQGEISEQSALSVIFSQCRMLGIRPAQVLALEDGAE